ncbi:MAG: cyclic nucleotide-binding domain-containing protein [Persicimonas sp.]
MNDEQAKEEPQDDSLEGAADLSETVQTRPTIPEGQAGLGASTSSAEASGAAETVFRSIELFEELESEEVREVVGACEQLSLAAGTELFRQGDEADALYIVESGELQVRARTAAGEDVVLAMLGSGTVVGEMSLIAGGPRSATVEVVSDAAIFKLGRDAFDSLRSARRPAAYKIILRLARILGERRRQTDARVEEVFEDPEQYLESFESQVHEMLGRIKKA